jgi:hypothetical protein
MNASGTGAASSAAFTSLPVTENATLTEDRYQVKSGYPIYYGFSYNNPYGNGTGAISPKFLAGGVLAYSQFGDNAGSGGDLEIRGFTADPGAGWLVSATGSSATLQGSAATYRYSAGTAIWNWTSLFGFGGSGTVAVHINHH